MVVWRMKGCLFSRLFQAATEVKTTDSFFRMCNTWCMSKRRKVVPKPHDCIFYWLISLLSRFWYHRFPFDLSTIWNGFPMDDAAPVGARTHTGLGVLWVLVTFRGFLLVLSTLNQAFQELKLHMTLTLESHTSIKNYWPNVVQIWILFEITNVIQLLESELIALLDCFAALIKMRRYHFVHSLLQLKWLVFYINLLQIAADVKLSSW